MALLSLSSILPTHETFASPVDGGLAIIVALDNPTLARMKLQLEASSDRFTLSSTVSLSEYGTDCGPEFVRRFVDYRNLCSFALVDSRVVSELSALSRTALLRSIHPGGSLALWRCEANGSEWKSGLSVIDRLATVVQLMVGVDDSLSSDFNQLKCYASVSLITRGSEAFGLRDYTTDEVVLQLRATQFPNALSTKTFSSSRLHVSVLNSDKFPVPHFPSVGTDLYLCRIKEATVGRKQVLRSESGLIIDSFRRYDPTRPHSAISPINDRRFRLESGLIPTRRIDGRAFYFDTEHSFHYGHFLLEAVSRAWALRNLDTTGMKFLVPTLKPFHRDFLELLGVPESDVIEVNSTFSVEELLVSKQGFVLEQFATQQAFDVYRDIAKKSDSKNHRAEKIYVSRTKFTDKRNLIEEQEIENYMREIGFEILHPQNLNVKQQASYFSQARLIVGPSGSGMYNSVFCRPGSRRLIIASEKFASFNDLLISDFTDTSLDFFFGKGLSDDPMRGDWSINVQEFKQALKNWMRE